MRTQTTQTVSKRVLVDLDRCIECRSCAAACSVSHANVPAIQFARAGWALLPVVCRQCQAAPCVDACPAEAMVRDDDGVVRRRLFRCVGCSSCVRACPFGVIPTRLAGAPAGARSPDRLSGRQAAKCDLCFDRTASGDGEPRCVAACPSGALLFADERDGEAIGVDLIGGRTAGEHPFKRR